MATKTCPRCGARFACDGDSDCWCEQLQLHRAQLMEILQTFTDCICPDCMKAYESKV